MTGATMLERPVGPAEAMPCITVRPPWSWCISVGAKLTENRGRPVAEKWIGLDWAVHSGARWDRAGAEDPRVLAAWRAWWGRPRYGPPARSELPTGAVVAVARLAGCHQAVHDGCGNTCCRPWGQPWWETGWGAEPAWHLVFEHVRRLLAPVRCRGQLAVPWTLPTDVAAQVAAQLGEVTR